MKPKIITEKMKELHDDIGRIVFWAIMFAIQVVDLAVDIARHAETGNAWIGATFLVICSGTLLIVHSLYASRLVKAIRKENAQEHAEHHIKYPNDLIHEDILWSEEMYSTLVAWKEEANVAVLAAKRNISDATLYIYTSSIGKMVGYQGRLSKKYTPRLLETKLIKNVKFVEIDGFITAKEQFTEIDQKYHDKLIDAHISFRLRGDL